MMRKAALYTVLSFDMEDDAISRRMARSFSDLARAMLHGAEQLALREGVVILRSDHGVAQVDEEDDSIVAACGAAEDGAVAFMACADFRGGRWPTEVTKRRWDWSRRIGL